MIFLMWMGFAGWTFACEKPADLVQVGEAKLRVWGFSIYTATSYRCADTRLGDGSNVQGPFMLTLTYARRIDSEDLIEATRDQWQRLGLATDRGPGWLQALDSLWPDVNKGDRLSLFIDRSGQSAFFMGDQLLGHIADPAFGPAFAAIWLHPDASYQQVRTALLGDQ